MPDIFGRKQLNYLVLASKFEQGSDILERMKNFKWPFILFIALLILDQFIKWFITSNGITYFSSLINLTPAPNAGIIFGNLADADPFIRTIFFSCFFILVLFIAFFIQFYFLREDRFKKISIALSIYVSGISGNALDRIRLGYAIDYAHFPFSFLDSFVINFADFVQIIGAFLCLLFLFEIKDDLWPNDNERGFRLVDKRYQFGFSLKLAFISFFSVLMTGTFSYAFLKVYISEFDTTIKKTFLVSWIVIGLLLILCSFVFGLILSSRSAGPIFALERFIHSLKQGEDAKLKLRTLDSFKRLEKLADDIRELKNK
jgi:signal peptidase II